MDLFKKKKPTDSDTTITKTEGKRPNVTGLGSTGVFNAVENKIPDISNLVNKTGYDPKITDIEYKYFTTSDYKKFTNEIIFNKTKEEELVKKSNISGFINNSDLD